MGLRLDIIKGKMYNQAQMFKKNTNYPPDWFSTWFDEDYCDVYNHRDDQEAEEFVANWQIWNRLRAGDLCLDLGCGTGRYSKLLAERGLSVIAVDLSTPLLNRAKKNSMFDPNLLLIRADMRAIPVREKFSLVVSLFTSFGYFETDDENLQVLHQVFEALLPGGLFIIDYFNPSAVQDRVRNEPSSYKTVKNISITEKRSINRETMRVDKRIFLDDGNQTKEYCESVRMYEPGELETMLLTVGLRPICLPWGDYQGELLNESSPRMIFFCEKSV